MVDLNNFSVDDIERIVSKMEGSIGKKEQQKDFELLEVYEILSTTRKTKTVFSKVRWRNFIRYDLRKWNLDLSTPYKGISFTKEELKQILSIGSQKIEDEARYSYSSDRIQAQIYNQILTFSEHKEGEELWIKQICIVDWGYGKSFDFRKWTKNYEKCSRGISLSPKIFVQFYNTIQQIINSI